MGEIELLDNLRLGPEAPLRISIKEFTVRCGKRLSFPGQTCCVLNSWVASPDTRTSYWDTSWRERILEIREDKDYKVS